MTRAAKGNADEGNDTDENGLFVSNNGDGDEPDTKPAVVERVAVVSATGKVDYYDSEEDAVANWAVDSSHILTVRVPRKDDED